MPLASLLSERLGGIDVRVGNDVEVAVIAEHRLGAGAGVDDLLGVWVGTGVGGGLVLDGRSRRLAGRGVARSRDNRQRCRGETQAVLRGPPQVAFRVHGAREVVVQIAAFGHVAKEWQQSRRDVPDRVEVPQRRALGGRPRRTVVQRRR